MPTVLDVANLAEVSVATVSRVLQNSNRVSDEKRERVQKAIDQLGYKPHVNMESGIMRRKTILVICGNCQDEFIDNINEAASEYDYDTAIYYMGGHSVRLNAFINKLIKGKVIVGVITFGLTLGSSNAMAKIAQQIPVVQCCDDLQLENAFIVSSDDRAMARDAVSFLLKKGYRRIGFLGLGNLKSRFVYSDERYEGYCSELLANQITLDENLVAQCDFSNESVEHAMDRLLALPQRPDAIFCVRDQTAKQVVHYLTRNGINIPNEVAVMGCGGDESAEQCWLPLTNVMYSYYDISMEAMDLLQKRITGKLTCGRRINIQHEVRQRQTT